MSPAPYNHRQTYPLALGFTVEFILSGNDLTVEWSPEIPAKATGLLLLPLYRLARNDFLASLDVAMLVVDL